METVYRDFEHMLNFIQSPLTHLKHKWLMFIMDEFPHKRLWGLETVRMTVLVQYSWK